MPQIIRHEPWNMLNQLQREIDHLFASHLGRENAELNQADWVPAVDVLEEADRYLIRADVPGVDPQDIDSHVEDGTLVISGKREHESQESRENYRRVERVTGAFERRFGLPESADAENISAKSRHGVLEVSIPKRRQSLARKITVES